MAKGYRRDRTAGQKATVYLGVEKNGLLNLLLRWFEGYGVNVVALGGYSSQTFVDDIARDVQRQGRPAILIYGGDFDPSGVDILRDFRERTRCWDRLHRIALNPAQIERYDLPPLPGKATDSRARSFVHEHGTLVQVELDALPPDILRSLYQRAFDHYWDPEAYEEAMTQEEEDKQTLLSWIPEEERENE